MSSLPHVQICHSDESLVAEVKFWAASAGYITDVAESDAPHQLAATDVAATILELTGNSDHEVDLIESFVQRGAGKVLAVTSLDAKTVASIRRLFQQKSIDAIILSRSEFSTRHLSDLLKAGRGCIALSSEALSDAIRDGGVVVHYQPKVPFRAGAEGFGVEALCRLNHPPGSMVFPDEFIPLAEAHGLIKDLTDAVTVQAFKDLAIWDAGGSKLKLAINVSPRLMSDMSWFELFEGRCKEYNIDPKRITLEVTESSSQGGKMLALEILSRLRLKGFLLSIDDFGTGFSSLETLYKLPFGELKIDKGFVLDLLKSQEARTLVESTISLARKLGLRITAEGVETVELFQELRSLQCDDAQGYFISKPIPADKIPPFFEGWQRENPIRQEAGAPGLRTIHALLAEILSTDDDEDATIVLGSAKQTSSSRDEAAKIPALLMSGNTLGCLEHVHRALLFKETNTDLKTKLESLRGELERTMLTKSLVLRHAGKEFHILGGTEFSLGRESASSIADIAVPCRWLSRAPKNLQISHNEGHWQLCDLGSTNGHFLNGLRLSLNESVALPAGSTTLEVGKVDGQRAPAWLCFHVLSERALEISFGTLEAAPSEARRWVVFTDELTIAKDPTGDSLFLGKCGSADIIMREGLWIAPRPGKTVLIDGHEFSGAVPLVAGADIRIGDITLQTADDFGSDTEQRIQAIA